MNECVAKSYLNERVSYVVVVPDSFPVCLMSVMHRYIKHMAGRLGLRGVYTFRAQINHFAENWEGKHASFATQTKYVTVPFIPPLGS